MNDPTADPPDWCAECGRQQLASCWMLTARAVLCDECAARLRPTTGSAPNGRPQTASPPAPRRVEAMAVRVGDPFPTRTVTQANTREEQDS